LIKRLFNRLVMCF